MTCDRCKHSYSICYSPVSRKKLTVKLPYACDRKARGGKVDNRDSAAPQTFTGEISKEAKSVFLQYPPMGKRTSATFITGYATD
ncbi:hypothetical protein [Calothrix sp. NIES-2098]|uniref:hypothetical protein n=1 Tax=Calothrix sp. NIES-2098 TaxID=1954171 RepID=UPI000B5DC9DC|nr:hypothetical protein NIES2098_03390 [Calothrix sp. NIES-2098]